MAAGESEGRQLAGANPAKYRGIAHSATLGNKPDRDKFRGPLLRYLMQAEPPYREVFGGTVVPFSVQTAPSAFSALVMFGAFVVYESAITEMSQGKAKNSHKYHRRSSGMAFLAQNSLHNIDRVVGSRRF